MSYRSGTIALAIGRMNRQYFLPAIGREFVWNPEQIVQLSDSIMRGYPVSSFLFWKLKSENRDKWQVYGFFVNAADDSMIGILEGGGQRPHTCARVRTRSGAKQQV